MPEMGQENVRYPLERLFGSASARVLDFLLVNDGLHYSKSEIVKFAGVTARPLQKSLQVLLDEGMIRRSRVGGRAYNYSANLDSPRVVALLKYIQATANSNLDAILENLRRK